MAASSLPAGPDAPHPGWSPADAAFVTAVECGAPAHGDFDHRAHLRLAWLYLSAGPFEEAAARMARSVRRLAARAGAEHKFHVTMTAGWMSLVAAAMSASPGAASFDALLAAHPGLLDRHALARHYSGTRLGSEEARTRLVPPDLRPFDSPGSQRPGLVEIR